MVSTKAQESQNLLVPQILSQRSHHVPHEIELKHAMFMDLELDSLTKGDSVMDKVNS